MEPATRGLSCPSRWDGVMARSCWQRPGRAGRPRGLWEASEVWDPERKRARPAPGKWGARSRQVFGDGRTRCRECEDGLVRGSLALSALRDTLGPRRPRGVSR